MRGRRLLMVALPLTGMVAGLMAAFIRPTAHGAGHSCPAGAPIEACFYPPDLLRQRIAWALVGLLAGCALSWLIWVLSTTNLHKRRAE